MKCCCCFPHFMGGLGAIGLLSVRLVMGSAFILHGWPKIQNATGWMGEAPVPGILQALAALAEFGGGIALVIGLLTPLASLGIAGTMIGALTLVHVPLGHAFVASKMGENSFELTAVYLTCSLMFLTVGPGTLSLDACLFRRSSAPQP